MTLAPAVLLFALQAAPASEDQPTTCYERTESRCRDYVGDAGLRCRLQGEAECDVTEAEHFIADGKVDNALARVDQARQKYEQLIDITDLRDREPLVVVLVRYLTVTQKVFPLLSVDRSIDDLTPLVDRLRAGRQFVASLIERVPVLAEHPALAGMRADFTAHLVITLDHLGEIEMQQAEALRIRDSAHKRDDAFGTVKDLYDLAAQHFAEAFALAPTTTAYFARLLDTRLAKSALYASSARRGPEDVTRACTGYRDVLHRLEEFQRKQPASSKAQPRLAELRTRAQSGTAVCRSRGHFVAGGALVGVGAAALLTSLVLYANYDRTCDFNEETRVCDGIESPSPEATRFTREVHAAISLAVVGGAVATTGATLLVRGAVLRRRMNNPAQLSLTPVLAPQFQGASLRFRF